MIYKRITLVMKKIALICSLLLCGWAPADLVKLDGGKVTFEAPEGFKKLAQDVIDKKWPSKRGPAFVVGNEAATTTIAYDIKPFKVPADELPKVQKSFTDQFSRIIPGIAWKKNKIIKLAGRNWIYLEMTSNAVDTDIYNMMLVTGYEGKMLVFNFNSTKEEFPQYEKRLRKSLNSISFKAGAKKQKK